MIEFTKDESEKFILEIDSTSLINQIIIPNGWKCINSNISKNINTYSTNFGYPRKHNDNFNAISINYDLARNSFVLFIKMFIALFISFLIACSSIFISSDSFEPRFALIVGGLFGTISNKYVTNNILPETSSLNLSDKLHLITFSYILILTIITIIENRYKLQDNIKYERYAFFGIIISYIVIILNVVVSLP